MKRWPSDLWLAADRPKRLASEKKWAALPQRDSLPVAPGSSPFGRRAGRLVCFTGPGDTGDIREGRRGSVLPAERSYAASLKARRSVFRQARKKLGRIGDVSDRRILGSDGLTDQSQVEEPPSAGAFFDSAEKLPAGGPGFGQGLGVGFEIAFTLGENSGHIEMAHTDGASGWLGGEHTATDKKPLQLLDGWRAITIFFCLEQIALGHGDEEGVNLSAALPDKRGDDLGRRFSTRVIAQ